MVVGVTGKYCAGKNQISQILGSAGFEVVDVDRLGHRALEEDRDEVVSRFGSSILGPDGKIARRELGEIVFASPAALRSLEAIIHPTMVRYVEDEIDRRAGKDIVINAAILFQMGLHRLCDRVLWVRAPLAVRVRRAVRRDELSLLQIARRIWSQRKLSPQPFRNLVDIYIVHNSGSIQALEGGVLRLVTTARE